MVELFVKLNSFLLSFLDTRHGLAWLSVSQDAMNLGGKPGQHSCLAVMVTWLWMSHRLDTRRSIKSSFKTTPPTHTFPFKPLVWFGIGKWGQIDIYYFSVEIYSLNTGWVTFPTLSLRSAFSPLASLSPETGKNWLKSCFGDVLNSLPCPPTPVKHPAFRHNLQIEALEAKGSQNHSS